MTPPEFADLLERVKAGDALALSQLMNHYHAAFDRAARKLLGRALQPHLDSEDLVQSVAIILWQGLRDGNFEVENPEQLLALAKVLLQRRAARHWRRLKPLADRATNGGVEDRPVSETASWGADFDDAMERLLSQFSDIDRRLVELRFQGHSTAEAARLLNLDPGFLRVRLARLRQHLREQLGRSRPAFEL
jgi:RNA polymerase sigma-70 factor (ECF subfamily)